MSRKWNLSWRVAQGTFDWLLDHHRSYICYLLEICPWLNAVKVAHKSCQKNGELAVSERGIRRYVQRA